MAQNDDIYIIPKGSPVAPDRYDCRTRLRNLTRGLLTSEDVKQYHESLPDDAAVAEYVDYNALVTGEETEENSSGGTPREPGIDQGPLTH